MQMLRNGAYQQDKADTNKVSTWLAQAVVEHGFPNTALQASARSLLDSGKDLTSAQIKNAKKVKKQAAKHNALRDIHNQPPAEESFGEIPAVTDAASASASDHIFHFFGRERVMGGKVPETLLDAWIGYLKMTGSSVRKGDTGLPLHCYGERPVPKNPDDKFPFQDWTRTVKSWRLRYQSSKDVTPVNLDYIHSLLCELAGEEDKKASEDELAETRKEEAKREKPGHAILRRHWNRTRRTRKPSKKRDVSILRLLDVLETHLDKELDIVNFDHDYIGLHARCGRMMQTITTALLDGADHIPDRDEVIQKGRVVDRGFHTVALRAVNLSQAVTRLQ
ncbi:hypothetical protein OC842_002458 [Tilletia horrida]|uniref:Uncharacterized protein n=1 Tax=Tilletia horrida TaxID=155126 RepID=A0AAN6GDL5_9BASI|nr:hypothetical protein OC842_002458 [Tilletia horrida]